MATRTVVTLVDDVDGSTAEESVSFGLDGVEYEIDLSAEHAEALRGVLEPYAAAARRTGGRRGARTAPRPASSGSDGAAPARSRSTNAQIRTWAAEHGVTLAERGRLPGRVIEAFEAGDPSRLPSSDGTASDGAGSDGAAPEPEPAPAASSASSADGGETRGRDGLTSSEREQIRSWAVEQGIEVKPRGQLRKDLISNYRAWESRR
ncbi:Lsr2 family protein [Actinomycetospora sp. TBRC 11914]|uniref:histone-like nucleoid-structuring protein Lsr2 n=1 Tax=Actinomycetospora sp. TBRC 11914 TaxID=2729387 RepID=UPI00145F8F70|nr:Lsr2 family protein [Actinomycetospora sp. TBRC 11914]NMO88473.1 Lsr2 family protein [Actinomycetospora sp. TBRC 11914]